MGKDVYFKIYLRNSVQLLEKTLKIKYTYTIQNYSSHQSILGNCTNSGCCRILGIAEKKRKRTLTPTKIVLGLFISGLILSGNGFSNGGDNGAVKVSPLWLVASYGVITIGELCLSPMGLSFVSKLSPARITALMMGGFSLPTL
jgi:POT family proton-dependent oligopeptide transporter